MSEEELPEGWVETRLDAVAEVRLGRQRSPDRATGPNMAPYMRAANVTWNGLSLHDVKEMDFSPAERPTYELRKGDVLVGEASGSRAEVGKSAVWQGEIPGACFQNTLIRVRPQGGLIDSGFLQLRLKHDALRGALADASRGVGIHHLGREALAGWEVPLPPLNEQRRIVAKLEDLLARSRRAKHALDAVPPLLEKLRQSILASAFRGDLTADWRAQHPDVEPASELLKRIRLERRKKWEEAELKKLKAKGKAPSDERWKQKYQEPEPVDASELPELPEGWCWAKLPLLGELARGKSKHRPRNDPRLFGERMPFIQTGEVARSGGLITKYSSMYSDFGVDQSRVFPSGTVCITIAASIAETGILGFDACFPDSVVGFTADGGHVAGKYVEYFLRTARSDLKRFAPATAQANINLEILAEVAVPVAPPAETELLVKMLETAFLAVGRLELMFVEASNRGLAIDRSFLAKAFRGELVPQDPSDEPASRLLERLAQERAAGEASAPKRTARKPSAPEPAAKKSTPSKSKKVR